MKELYSYICVLFFSVFIFSTETKAQLNVTISKVVSPSCHGYCNGSMQAIPAGGTAPYTYVWSTSSQTTQAIHGLCAGVYTVVVTDSTMATASASITLTEPPKLTANITTVVNTSDYAACDGSLTVSVLGGTPPYTYFWNPKVGRSATATGLCPGNYSVLVLDANGFTVTTSGSVSIESSSFNSPPNSPPSSTSQPQYSRVSWGIWILELVNGLKQPYTKN